MIIYYENIMNIVKIVESNPRYQKQSVWMCTTEKIPWTSLRLDQNTRLDYSIIYNLHPLWYNDDVEIRNATKRSIEDANVNVEKNVFNQTK